MSLVTVALGVGPSIVVVVAIIVVIKVYRQVSYIHGVTGGLGGALK